MSAELTQQELKDFLHYNPETGHFTYNYWYRGVQKGTIAGTLNGGYLSTRVNSKHYQLHRLAFLWMEGVLPAKGVDVDHINCNKSDNRWSNLRLCTRSQNCHNVKLSPNNTTGIKGLSLTKQGYYVVQIDANNVRATRLFKVTEKEEAIRWLKSTREAMHMEFVNHGN